LPVREREYVGACAFTNINLYTYRCIGAYT
jgi:hypothetical protein